MSLSRLARWLSDSLHRFAARIDRRTTLRLPLLLGALLASGGRTLNSWFRAAGIADKFPPPTLRRPWHGDKREALQREVLR
jgi:hypothetical protein